MLVIFKNEHDERLINTDKISAIWKNKASKQPDFFVEAHIGGMRFNSLEWNGLTKECVTLNDVWLALRYFEKLNKTGVE